MSNLSRVGMDFAEVSTRFVIVIAEALSWKHHVSNVNSKIARTIFSIKQVKTRQSEMANTSPSHMPVLGNVHPIKIEKK